MSEKKKVRDYYKILIISQSGKGKTYSFRNMDKARTGYINPEDKPIPFEGNFKYHARPRKFAGVLKAFQDYVTNPEIEVVILDGLNMAFDMLVEEMRTNFRGYEIWSNYNIRVTELIKAIKAADKEVIVTGHYEVLNVEGEPEKRLKVLGKEHEGRIESHFTIVLYADGRIKDNKPDFFFKTTGEGLSAKCPPAIFGEEIFRVPNDSKVVVDKVVEFAKKSEREVETQKDIFS
jgi:hypothetical protein